MQFADFLKLDTFNGPLKEDGSAIKYNYFKYEDGSELLYHDFKVLWDCDRIAAEENLKDYHNLNGIEEYYEDWYKYLKDNLEEKELQNPLANDSQKNEGIKIGKNSCYLNSVVQALNSLP